MLKHIHDRSLLFGQVLGIMVIITLISISFFGLYSVRSAADQMGQGKAGIQIISATLMDEWREVANC
ncbi:hypothetical protein [Aeromonas veronii]|uniref:hypothetical protein n=1 Tax=Aeromonas veronii TaxID=654 RepID=UPI003D1E456E